MARVPWTAVAITLLVILGSGFAADPIRDAITGETVGEVVLTRSLAYIVLAPLSDVLDVLTLLSKAQHIAFVAAILVLFVVWRIVVAWRRRSTLRGHALSFAAVLAGLVVLYAAMALLPRPMAYLTSEDANIVRVDFHSHTRASHDGRPGWGAEQNREWHRDGGYDVAYVTDHASVTEAERGMARNPSPAGDGVTLLQGIEVTWTGEHVAILGAERTYKGLLTANGRDVDVEGLRLASLIPNREPAVIWNHPHHLDRLPIASGPRTPGVRAIEVSNGAPDSMDEVRRQRQAIFALATQHQLTMTSGTDNHGWGRTAPNWTLLVIYGWRALSTDALATQIENLVRNGSPESTRIIERRTAPSTSGLSVAATIVTAPGVMLATMSSDERVSWLVWTWAITLLVWVVRRRRALPGTP